MADTETSHVYQYGGSRIPYTLVYKNRTTLAIEVHPDSSVHVKAPLDAELEAIEAKLGKRAPWIRRQQQKFSEYALPLTERQYITGETYRYLGKQYRLKVTRSDEKRVRLWRGYIEVYALDTATKDDLAGLVSAWFRGRAEEVFSERYSVCVRAAKIHGVEHEGGFELRRMPKRWGSCTKEGRIHLNPILISASKDCIDYVITHELCHTVEHNHSADFYDLLSRVMPDWEKRQGRLNTLVEPFTL